VGIFQLLDDGDVLELDVEVLVDALEDAADLNVVLELDCDLMVDEGFEEAIDDDECLSSRGSGVRPHDGG